MKTCTVYDCNPTNKKQKNLRLKYRGKDLGIYATPYQSDPVKDILAKASRFHTCENATSLPIARQLWIWAWLGGGIRGAGFEGFTRAFERVPRKRYGTIQDAYF